MRRETTLNQMNKYKVICGDCIEEMKKMEAESVDVVCTSPVYNLKIPYQSYNDNLPQQKYLKWLGQVFIEIKRILKKDGSFFLNIGFSNLQPWLALDVANQARQQFKLQNNICWIKSIAIEDITHGHFKPIRSKRYTHCNWEHIFHFTHECKVEIDRLAIGVPYIHKYNTKRWKHNEGSDLRCKGNTWFIPYSTIHGKIEKNNHPAVFPIAVPESCILLHGIQKKMVVLDPFVGVGSTLQACQNLRVTGIGIDIDETYCAETQKRINKFKQSLMI